MKTTTPTAEVTKTYRRLIPNTWWLQKQSYVLFMLRELSAVFVAIYAVFLLIQVYSVANGPESYAHWNAFFQSGWVILLHVVILAFVMYHMITWFKISGRIFGFGKLTPGVIVAANYVLWLVVTAGLVFVLV